jgi:beta-lactamase superfamily II metal-dependent hydrolase
MTFCFPQVGQADAAVLRSGDLTVVIDCAAQAPPGRTSPVVRALSGAGTKKIDAVFLTHAHPDHIGGFEEIASRWKVGTLYLPVVEKDPARWSRTIGLLPAGSEVVSLVKGDAVRLGSLSFSVLGPGTDWETKEGENAGSLIMHVSGEGFSALFTGDAGWDQVLESLGSIEHLDLLKIPHHGSKSGFPPPGLENGVSRLRRKGDMTAVFPSPPPSTEGLPAREVVDWFETRGIRCVFTGGENGVSLEVGGEKEPELTALRGHDCVRSVHDY